MKTDLAEHIQATRMIDSHEHLDTEKVYVTGGPDVLGDLFDNYLLHDLVVAGASPVAVGRLLDGTDPDLEARFAGVRDAWQRCLHTGYGEAVQAIARRVYGMNEITPEALHAAQERNAALRRPGERLRILRDEAHLDHVQIDDFIWACKPDLSGPDFFLYDLSWVGFCSGEVKTTELYRDVGVEVENLATLRTAMEALFARYGACAIAVKSQHAYTRTLRWEKRPDAEAEAVLQKHLAGHALDEADELCLGDWSLARGVELAIDYNLPFKIHTGYHAGHSSMPIELIRSGHLAPLLKEYPEARFVLMHTAYPYSNELIALAKHYPNTYVDMCWAWSIDPFSARDFVRRMIHAVPSHKLFAFGGDARWPNAVVAYANQARRWLTRALQAEVDEGFLTGPQAMGLATRFMRTNQEACFDIAGTRRAIVEGAIPAAKATEN